MDNNSFFDPESGELIVGGEILPRAPFQIFISDPDYAKRYDLEQKQCFTVTDIRYVISRKQIRYSIKEALFDFPWISESIQLIPTYSTN